MTDFNKQNFAEEAPVLSPSPLESESSADQHSLPLESLKAVLDVTALALEPERFTGSTSAVVTALASRLACDRVSLGIATRNQLRVQALSHSAQFNHKTDLLNAIAASMEEAVDQQQTVLAAGDPGQGSPAEPEERGKP